jgi:hypothetical protein
LRACGSPRTPSSRLTIGGATLACSLAGIHRYGATAVTDTPAPRGRGQQRKTQDTRPIGIKSPCPDTSIPSSSIVRSTRVDAATSRGAACLPEWTNADRASPWAGLFWPSFSAPSPLRYSFSSDLTGREAVRPGCSSRRPAENARIEAQASIITAMLCLVAAWHGCDGRARI